MVRTVLDNYITMRVMKYNYGFPHYIVLTIWKIPKIVIGW